MWKLPSTQNLPFQKMTPFFAIILVTKIQFLVAYRFSPSCTLIIDIFYKKCFVVALQARFFCNQFHQMYWEMITQTGMPNRIFLNQLAWCFCKRIRELGYLNHQHLRWILWPYVTHPKKKLKMVFGASGNALWHFSGGAPSPIWLSSSIS